MNDLETKLRDASAETRSAFSTVTGRVAMPTRSRASRGLTAALAGAAVVLVIGLPALLFSPGAAPNAPLGSEVTTTIVTSSNTVALDPSWLVPTAADVEAIIADAEAQGAPGVHEADWRPELRSEGLWCLYQDSVGAATTASNGPLDLDLPLTVDDLLTECAPGNNDGLSETAPIPTDFTVCRGVFDDASYEEIRTSDEFRMVEPASVEPPGFPVVLGWAADCETAAVETSPNVPRLSHDLSMEMINQVREIEIALRGHQIRGTCPEATPENMARSVHHQLGAGWTILSGEIHEWCGLWISPQWSTISFAAGGADEGLGSEDGSSISPPTVPPSTPAG